MDSPRLGMHFHIGKSFWKFASVNGRRLDSCNVPMCIHTADPCTIDSYTHIQRKITRHMEGNYVCNSLHTCVRTNPTPWGFLPGKDCGTGSALALGNRRLFRECPVPWDSPYHINSTCIPSVGTISDSPISTEKPSRSYMKLTFAYMTSSTSIGIFARKDKPAEIYGSRTSD